MQLHNALPAAQKVEEQDYHRRNQQEVDQATGHMEAESEEPQNHENNEDRPKHMNLFPCGGTRDVTPRMPCTFPDRLFFVRLCYCLGLCTFHHRQERFGSGRYRNLAGQRGSSCNVATVDSLHGIVVAADRGAVKA